LCKERKESASKHHLETKRLPLTARFCISGATNISSS